MDLTFLTAPPEPPGHDPELLLHRASHRLDRELAGAAAVLDGAASDVGDPVARAALDAAAKRLHGYARLNRALRTPARAGAVDVAGRLRDLCEAVHLSHLAPRDLALVYVERPLRLDAARSWLLTLAAYELIAGAARCASAAPGGEIRVELRAVRDFAELRVETEDTARARLRGDRALAIVDRIAACLRGCFEHEVHLRGAASSLVFPLRA